MDNRLNILDAIKINSNHLEDDIVSNNEHFKCLKKDSLIENARLPLFSTTFFSCVIYTQSLPPLDYCLDAYLLNFAFELSRYVDHLEGLRERFRRAYLSLIRQLHVSLKIREKFQNVRVVYDYHSDIKNGADLIVVFNDKKYVLEMYQDTINNDEFLTRKRKYQQKIDDAIYVQMPFGKDKKVIGNIYLYSDESIDEFMTKIVEEQNG